MRNYLLIPALASIIFTGCTNKNADNHEHNDQATHEHEDGTMHHNHEEGDFKQEEFKIDSNAQNSDQEKTTHSHDDGSHQH